MALRVICMDQLDKDTVKNGLKKITLMNVKDKKDMKLPFNEGELAMHFAYAQRSGGMFSDNEIRNELLKAL
jgi:hypothetical protein